MRKFKYYISIVLVIIISIYFYYKSGYSKRNYNINNYKKLNIGDDKNKLIKILGVPFDTVVTNAIEKEVIYHYLPPWHYFSDNIKFKVDSNNKIISITDPE